MMIAEASEIPIAGDVVRRESDQREDGWRRAAFHPDTCDRLNYIMIGPRMAARTHG